MTAPYAPWRHRSAVVTLIATFVLVGFGAFVKSFEAGMAFPDWPTSDGYFMYLLPLDQRTGAKFWEHTHRELGTLVGFCLLGMTLLVVRGEKRPLVRRLTAWAVPILLAQAYLGGSTVLNELKIKAISIAHGCIAQAFTGLILMICVLTSASWISATLGPRVPFRRIHSLVPAFILLQLFFGAMYRHTLSTHALISHAVFAFVVVGAVVWSALMIFRDFKGVAAMTRTAVFMCVLCFVQIALGTGAYLLRSMAEGAHVVPVHRAVTASSHVITGLVMLCGSLVIYMHTRRADNPEFGS